MGTRSVHSDALVGLVLGVYATAALLMLFWVLSPVVWLPAAHFVLIECAWIFAWRVCVREGRTMPAHAVLFGGAFVTVLGLFGLLGVFVRVYN